MSLIVRDCITRISASAHSGVGADMLGGVASPPHCVCTPSLIACPPGARWPFHCTRRRRRPGQAVTARRLQRHRSHRDKRSQNCIDYGGHQSNRIQADRSQSYNRSRRQSYGGGNRRQSYSGGTRDGRTRDSNGRTLNQAVNVSAIVSKFSADNGSVLHSDARSAAKLTAAAAAAAT